MTLQILSLCLLFSLVLYSDDLILNEHESPAELVETAMPNTLDTLGEDDSGNWVLKRVWWEKAEDAFGKIMALNLQVSQQQMEYFGVRNEIDKRLDTSKRDLVLTLDEIDKIVNRLLDLLGNQDNLADLDLTKNSFKGSILENKEKLIKLREAISQLNKLDGDMDSAIIKVIDQVQKCNDYEARAWEDFKQIGRVLNDEFAKNLYYQVVNYRKNIKMILRYLKTDLRTSFEGLMARAVDQLDDIKIKVAQLRDSGIDLVYESKMIHEGNPSVEEDLPQPKKQSKKAGIWGSVMNVFKMLGNLIWWLPRKLLALLGIKF